MKNNKFALPVLVFSLILLSFIACDSDFATLESDIITAENATNFDINSNRYEILTYTEALGPVQTNGLGLNSLGLYDDVYGRTTSNFVTQLIPDSFDPDFGDDVKMDSVVLTIPFYSTATAVDEDGIITYDVDSIIPDEDTFEPIKLRLFESNYFIRDFDPDGDFNDSQAYFSNQSASSSESISDASLEGTEITIVEDVETSHTANNIININKNGFVLTGVTDLDDPDAEPTTQNIAPGIRVKLDTTYWRNKIIDQAGESVLSSSNSFQDYFRGLYFKTEPNASNNGSFLIPNINSADITIYYSSLTETTTDDEDERDSDTFTLGFSSNSINFLNNDFTTPIADGDPVNGDSRIYLKGGEGSIGRITLFGGDNINDGDDLTFDNWKNEFVETDPDTGEFIRSRRLVNEANLVFFVDQEIVQDGEPNRIYLYDMDNKTPLFDYFDDVSNSSLPSFSILTHLGPLQRVNDDPDERGIKYKLRITGHINDLLLRDSTNVELGLSVSLNVNLEDPITSILQREVQDSNDSEITVPISSVISPRGTILHGSNTEDESKRVYLEIYYTEPN